jgi:phosphate:Na+ symporter
MPDAAIEALHNEILYLADNVMMLNIEGLRIADKEITTKDKQSERAFSSGTYMERYNKVNQLQGEAVKYFIHIQTEKLDPEDSARLNKHAHALRHLLKSAKRLKDVTHNVEDFESSGNDIKHALFEELRDNLTRLYSDIHELLHTNNNKTYRTPLEQLVLKNKDIYEQIRSGSYHQGQAGHLTEVELATFQNANHEIYSANKALLEALADMLLTTAELEKFEQLPELS